MTIRGRVLLDSIGIRTRRAQWSFGDICI